MADTPLFFYPKTINQGETIQLPEDTAKHIGQVLRMNSGETIQLTDGNGMVADCKLIKVEKKKVEALATRVDAVPESQPALRLAIAFTKNASRNEWLLEKATELGVRRITPLITERSNKDKIRHERWVSILTSAMLQSKQSWLPLLDQPTSLSSLVANADGDLLLAHCIGEGYAKRTIMKALKKDKNVCIMIGPEGDFSAAEVSLAEAAGAVSVSLGGNRLRTETAALAAVTHFYLINYV
jgi:16S rRNA (uracil1498-N3)-methyltransferase